MSKPIVMIGGGGHASVLVDILKQQGEEIIAIVCPEPPTLKVLEGIPHLVEDSDVLKYQADDVLLVNALGSLPGNKLRSRLYAFFKEKGYSFKSVIANCAYVSDYAELAEGVQVMQRAVVQTGTTIGENSIVNTGALVDHDCTIGAFNHIAPGACLSGQVSTGVSVHVGTGAAIIQAIHIGSHSVVAAGATVNKDIAEDKVVYAARNFIR